MHSVILPANV